MNFFSVRTIIVATAVLAQVYLFVRIAFALHTSIRSFRLKLGLIVLTGAVIGCLFAMNWRVMFRPILWVDPPDAVQMLLFYLPAVWTIGSILSALLLLLIQILSCGWKATVWIHHRLTGATSNEPNLSRRRFLQAGSGAFAAAPFLLGGYGTWSAWKDPVVEELTLPFGLPLRVVQLSDVHSGVFMTRHMMRRFVDRVISLRPEALVLTGDYISNSTIYFPSFVEEVSRIKCPLGSFAILGNHENWYGRSSYFESGFRRYGIPLLQNTHRIIQTEKGSFAIAGINDLRWGGADLGRALKDLDPSLPTMLLSHHPEIFPRAAALGVKLTLSGHYHGGQVKLRLPGGDFSLAHLWTRYPEGLYLQGNSRLYVSRGIGTTFTPVRLNASPEITLFHLM